MAQDQKQEAIIEAATKRFAHYGVAKTTMTEIAADLNLSKASLYYYFPDKINLYAAVIKAITDINEKEHMKGIENEKDPFKAIRFFLEQRTSFIVRYHNILEHIRTFQQVKPPPELLPVINELRKKELTRLVMIIDKGIVSGQFTITSARATAELLFDFLDGFRRAQLLGAANFFPERKDFLALLKKEQAFAEIFFKGLTIP